MSEFFAKLRALFRNVRAEADVVEFYYPRHRIAAADPLAVLMVTYRWTSS